MKHIPSLSRMSNRKIWKRELSMNILVVDDDFVSREKLKELLSVYGTCDVAASGQEGFDMFKAMSGEGTYQLVTVDVEMEDMKGQDLVQLIRDFERERIQKGPHVYSRILMISVKKDCENVMTSFFNNCDGYLVKPVTNENLDHALKKLGFSTS